jgi:hypothetical protein
MVPSAPVVKGLHDSTLRLSAELRLAVKMTKTRRNRHQVGGHTGYGRVRKTRTHSTTLDWEDHPLWVTPNEAF